MNDEHIRLRFVAPLRPKPAPASVKGEVAFLPMRAIGDSGTYDRESVGSADELRQAGYTYFEEGDVVRARVTPCFENRKGAYLVSLAGGSGLGTTELFVFSTSSGIDPRFLYYVTVSDDFTDAGTATLYGAHGVRRVDDQFARNYRVWLPEIGRQRAIADYLDRETGRIDALIAATEQMVLLLVERWEVLRIALVSGSRPAVPGYGGPAWLGFLPNTWSVERLKFLARMESGHTPDRTVDAYWVDCTIPWITLNDVGALQREWTITESANAINELGMANSAAHLLPAGTVVLSRDATVGRAAILGRPMAVSQHFVGWTCGPRLLPEYLLQVLRGPMQRHFATLTAGATIATIGMPELKELVVPVPAPDEQARIVAALRSAEDQFENARAALNRRLSLLQERRRSLVTAAVTGELDIAEAA